VTKEKVVANDLNEKVTKEKNLKKFFFPYK